MAVLLILSSLLWSLCKRFAFASHVKISLGWVPCIHYVHCKSIAHYVLLWRPNIFWVRNVDFRLTLDLGCLTMVNIFIFPKSIKSYQKSSLKMSLERCTRNTSCWWHHGMETLSVLPVLCESNHRSPVDFPAKGWETLYKGRGHDLSRQDRHVASL